MGVAVDEIHVVQSKKSCRIKELNKFEFQKSFFWKYCWE